MEIRGACHCRNIGYVLDWPDGAPQIPVRACDCTFCCKHGGSWTSHPDAALRVTIGDRSRVSVYRFGTATAEFHVCTTCGVVPFVTSTVQDHVYAVVNVNSFESLDPRALARAPAHFEGEESGARLARRARHWIPHVRIDGEETPPGGGEARS